MYSMVAASSRLVSGHSLLKQRAGFSSLLMAGHIRLQARLRCSFQLGFSRVDDSWITEWSPAIPTKNNDASHVLEGPACRHVTSPWHGSCAATDIPDSQAIVLFWALESVQTPPYLNITHSLALKLLHATPHDPPPAHPSLPSPLMLPRSVF